MRRFLRDAKGAVTVFVTLLLIPAILVSGTAVDLARIYTARSIVQDANQLAANSVLTQYNALLHDLYGVFGVAKDDPILAVLLDEYISVAVFGEDGKDTSMGTLQLFYGSNLSLDEIHFADGKNLKNPDVLERQILEYMKFRGPAIIVTELLELLGSSTFKGDAKVIEEKLAIDEAIAELYEKLKELYEAILAADKCTVVPSDPAGAVGNVSDYLGNLLSEFGKLKDCQKDWERELEKEELADPEVLADLEAKYKAILRNIESWTKGGKVGKDWKDGKWKSSSTVQGLKKTIENAIERADRHKPLFDDVVRIAAELDALMEKASEMVDELQRRLDSGECNPELRMALTMPSSSNGKSVMQMYRDILKWDDVEGMAKIYKDGGYWYIDEPLKEMLENTMYRNRNNASDPKLTIEQLAGASSLGSLALEEGNRFLSKLAGYDLKNDVSYKMPDGFVKFGEHPGDNEAFFKELAEMMSQPGIPPVSLYEGQAEAGGSNPEKKQRNMIDELVKLIDNAYAGMANAPLGAKHINGDTSDIGTEKPKSILDSIKEALQDPISDVLSDPLSSVKKAGDYLLVLTYCASMFSNYTTGRPETNGAIAFPKSISGVPLSPEVNYFFQSEWEYLYNGADNASRNLSAVSRLIFLVRVICNYITVFAVNDVTRVVNSIRSAFSWNPLLGLVLGELARAAFVVAESVADVANLRSGHKAPLIKSKNDWICSPSGIIRALDDVLSNAAKDDNAGNKDKGLAYSHYLLFFFLSKGLTSSNMARVLTERAANLIEWNVLNYEHGVKCDEGKMSGVLSAAGRFRMEDMKTDFSITTTVDMRMLFLSMAVAQNHSNSWGIGLPKTMPVTVTDYRGY